MRPAKGGSGDSGAAGGPSNSAIKIPEKTRAAPNRPRELRRSPIRRYEVMTANTGSSVNRIAAWLGVVYCCAHICRVKAMAVAKTAQTVMARSNSQRHWKRAGCQRIAEAEAAVTQAMTA